VHHLADRAEAKLEKEGELGDGASRALEELIERAQILAK
jgi:hypothetical protein